MDLLEAVGPSSLELNGTEFCILGTGSHSVAPLMASSLSVDSRTCWMF